MQVARIAAARTQAYVQIQASRVKQKSIDKSKACWCRVAVDFLLSKISNIVAKTKKITDWITERHIRLNQDVPGVGFKTVI